MELMDLPAEIFQEIVNTAVDSLELQKAMKLRLVSKAWDYQVIHGVFSRPRVHSQVIELKAWAVDESLLARLLWERLGLPGHLEFQVLAEVEDLADFLLANAASPLSRDEYLRRMCSMTAFNLGGMRLMMRFDTRLQVQRDRVRAPLAAAAFVGDNALVVKLLDERGLAFYQDYAGQALRAAAHAGQIETVRLLLRRGANPGDRASPCGNSLTAAASGGHLPIVDLLLSERLSRATDDYDSAIRLAAKNGHTEVVIRLIEARSYSTEAGAEANAEARDTCWMDALKYAASKGHLGTVNAILERGSFEHFKTPYGAPLYEASLRGWPKVVHALLERGHWKTKREADQLYQAARQGHTEVVELLIGYGMDMSAVPTSMTQRFPKPVSTPLFAAASGGHLNTVKLLLDKGADLSIDACGVGAVAEADKYGYTEVARILRAALLEAKPRSTPVPTSAGRSAGPAPEKQIIYPPSLDNTAAATIVPAAPTFFDRLAMLLSRRRTVRTASLNTAPSN